MEINALKESLQALGEANKNVDWEQMLDERKKQEIAFHDKVRDQALNESLPQDTYELLHSNKGFYAIVENSRAYVSDWLKGHVPGKVFLDYACGNGEQAINAAGLGAALSIGLDISGVSVGNARAAAEEQGFAERCLFVQGDCEHTGLPDGCIDVILCSGMLHHLDLSYAFPELRRILKDGGIMLAVEALDYNPAIKLYRQMTPNLRTEWEKNHILSMKDLRFASRFFIIGEVKYWHFCSIPCVIFKKNRLIFNAALRMMNWLDGLVLRIPGIRLLAWQFTFELVRRR